MNKIAMFDSKEYDKEYFTKENKNYSEIEIEYFKEKLTPETKHNAKGYDAVCVFVNDHVTAEVVQALHEDGIKVILNRCAGFNNVDIDMAKELGIKVLRVPAYSPVSVAEYGLTLMMGITRKLNQTVTRVSNMNFSIEGLVGKSLKNRTVGVISTGKIGKEFAQLVLGIGAKVIAFDKFQDEKWATEYGVKYVELDELYAQSEVISLHSPLFPETTHMINKASISKMRDGVIIINSSRGGLIDTRALLDAIDEGKIEGAGLDVYENEQECFFEDCSTKEIQDALLKRLVSNEKVILASHQAFLTEEGLSEIAKVTLDNFDGYLNNVDRESFTVV